jgi:hypothetical protein
VDVLALDLEEHQYDSHYGAYYEAILATDFSALRPKPTYILYKNNASPSGAVRKQVSEWLGKYGYEFISYHAGCGDPEMHALVGLPGSGDTRTEL